MDNIGDNVMAIICVVVGILIIGCALVPIVDNASVVETENTTITETSGYNTNRTDNYSWQGAISDLVLTFDSTTITINGETHTDGNPIKLNSNPRNFTNNQSLTYLNFNTSQNMNIMQVYPAFDSTISTYLNLFSGTVTYSDGVMTVTGIDGNNATYSKSKDVSVLYINDAIEYSDADETTFYGQLASPFTLGIGQSACKYYDQNYVIDTSTTTFDDGTIVHNDDGTVTVTLSGSQSYVGPYKWTGEIVNTETITSDSEYKDLYNIIPVLCILGMAYVLIRRFY